MRLLLRLATKSAWPGGEPDKQRALADFRLLDGESGLSMWAFELYNEAKDALLWVEAAVMIAEDWRTK